MKILNKTYNKANQPDPFFVRAAHEKGSGYSQRYTMKTLHLTLKKNWFELIASGKKTTEYREYKPYWERRLLKKKFDEVHFRNGYSKNSPFMRVVCKEIAVVPPTGGLLFNPANNEKLNGWQFAISIGTILELKYNKSLELTGEGRAASRVSEYSIDRAP